MKHEEYDYLKEKIGKLERMSEVTEQVNQSRRSSDRQADKPAKVNFALAVGFLTICFALVGTVSKNNRDSLEREMALTREYHKTRFEDERFWMLREVDRLKKERTFDVYGISQQEVNKSALEQRVAVMEQSVKSVPTMDMMFKTVKEVEYLRNSVDWLEQDKIERNSHATQRKE